MQTNTVLKPLIRYTIQVIAERERESLQTPKSSLKNEDLLFKKSPHEQELTDVKIQFDFRTNIKGAEKTCSLFFGWTRITSNWMVLLVYVPNHPKGSAFEKT
jgi:hypothetical protein